jgi:hypothetical protein
MSANAVDTRQTVEISGSPTKQLMLALGGLGFVAAGYFMMQAVEDTPKYSAAMIRILGYVTVGFFGFCTLVLLWRVLTQRGPVITLSPQGLCDVRVSSDVVPWPAIEAIKTWEHSGQRVMVVGLKPGEEAKLKLTVIAKMSRRANTSLGADGLAITAQGTQTTHDDLMAATIAFAEAHGRG